MIKIIYRYVRKHLGGTGDVTADTDPLEKKLEDAEAENRELRAKLASLEISHEE